MDDVITIQLDPTDEQPLVYISVTTREKNEMLLSIEGLVPDLEGRREDAAIFLPFDKAEKLVAALRTTINKERQADWAKGRTRFDPDILRQILEAMDGYDRLPTPNELSGGVAGLPGWPEIGESAAQYHYQLALDRGFIKEYVDDETGKSARWPYRLTYEGKLFLDETSDGDIWKQVKPHIISHGLRAGQSLAQELINRITQGVVS